MTIAIAFSIPSLQTYSPLMSLCADDSTWMLQSVPLFGELTTNDRVSCDVHAGNTMCWSSYVHSIKLFLLSVEQWSCALCFPMTSAFWGFFVSRPSASEMAHTYKHWCNGFTRCWMACLRSTWRTTACLPLPLAANYHHQRRYVWGPKNSHKPGRSIYYCCWILKKHLPTIWLWT